MWLILKHSYLVLQHTGWVLCKVFETGNEKKKTVGKEGLFFSMESPEAVDLEDISSHLWWDC